MHKSAHSRDLTQQWLERKKDYVQDNNRLSASDALLQARRSMPSSSTSASSSTRVTITRLGTGGGVAGLSALRKHSRSGTKPRRLLPILVKLAEDCTPIENSDSDSSTYDSFNEMETDSAKDESDCSDGYTTDGFATMDVFEYEVDDSSDSEDLYSHGSSSGTDDMVEVVAKALFAPSSSSSSDSDDFEILAQDADTEESDAPTDPELGCADYWTCIKCKNQKNNPMYRFCEKCYQIRKDHFPPRPKHRRKRSSLLGRRNNRSNSKMLGFSSPSTSSTISMPDDKPEDGVDGRISRNSSDGSGVNIGKKFMQRSMQARIKQRRRTLSLKQNANSAGESSCCSSQEQSPDEQHQQQQQSALHSASSYMAVAACASSQETYCSEFEHIVNVKQSNSNLFEHNYPNSQDSGYPSSETISSQMSSAPQSDDQSLAKSDSLASTVSAYSVGLSSQSSTEYEANGQQDDRNDAVAVTIKPTSSRTITSTTVGTPTSKSTIFNNNNETDDKMDRNTRKRKINFTNETSDAEIEDDELMAKKFRATEETDASNGMCMICLTEPKNGAFVHNRFLHVCCCYRCTVKVWNKRKRCPICNSQVKTVLKMFVH